MSTTSSTMIRNSGNRFSLLFFLPLFFAVAFFVWNILKVVQDTEYDNHYLEATSNIRVLSLGSSGMAKEFRWSCMDSIQQAAIDGRNE